MKISVGFLKVFFSTIIIMSFISSCGKSPTEPTPGAGLIGTWVSPNPINIYYESSFCTIDNTVILEGVDKWDLVWEIEETSPGKISIKETMIRHDYQSLTTLCTYQPGHVPVPSPNYYNGTITGQDIVIPGIYNGTLSGNTITGTWHNNDHPSDCYTVMTCSGEYSNTNEHILVRDGTAYASPTQSPVVIIPPSTHTPEGTATRTPTKTRTPVPANTGTVTRTFTKTPTVNQSETGTFTYTATGTRTFTGTPTDTATPTATPSLTFTITFTPTATQTRTGYCAGVFGNSTGTNANTWSSPGVLFVSQFYMPGTGTVKHIYVKIGSNATLMVGLYTNAGALLAKSEITNVPVAGMTAISIPDTAISTGFYRIAVQFNMGWMWGASGGSMPQYYNTWGDLPANLPTSFGTMSNESIFGFASYCP